MGRGKAEDVNRAVSAAKAAFNDWSNKTGAERAVFLRKIADLVKQEKSNLAKYESIDMGKPLPETEWDMDDVAGTFEFCLFFISDHFCYLFYYFSKSLHV